MAETKQTQNQAFITGYLKTKELKAEIFDGKEVIKGHIVISVEDRFGKSDVKVFLSQNALTKEGKENNLYKGLVTVQQTFKASDEVGIENADYVRVTGDLSDNIFYAIDKGDFVEQLKLRGTFVNRVEKEKNPSGCNVSIEGYLSEIKPMENGEVFLTLIGVGYNGAAQKFDGYIPGDLAQIFQQNYQVGCTATLNFAIINSVEVEQVQKSVGFGQTLGEAITRTTTKRVIFGGEVPNYNGLTKEQIQQAMLLRESEKEKSKQKALDKKQGAATTGGFTAPTGAAGNGFSTGGFGAATGGFATGVNAPTGGFVVK